MDRSKYTFGSLTQLMEHIFGNLMFKTGLDTIASFGGMFT